MNRRREGVERLDYRLFFRAMWRKGVISWELGFLLIIYLVRFICINFLYLISFIDNIISCIIFFMEFLCFYSFFN